MSTSSRNVRLTSRDVDLLTQLTRYGAATYPLLQATVLHDRRRTSVYRQLNRLAEVKLLEDLKTGPSNTSRPRDVQSLWVPTRAAYQLVGSNLRYKPIPLNAVRHTLAVAQVGLWFEARGHVVLSDREISHLAANWRNAGGGPFPSHAPWIRSTRVRPAGATGLYAVMNPLIHMPDLVVTDGCGRRHAFEIELSMKNSGRASENLESYAQSRVFTSMTYLLAPDSVETRFRSLVATYPPGSLPLNLRMQTLERIY